MELQFYANALFVVIYPDTIDFSRVEFQFLKLAILNTAADTTGFSRVEVQFLS